MNLRLTSVLATATLLLSACGEKDVEKPKAQELILNISTQDLAGNPVPMVRFYINGKKFGITDDDGSFRGNYPAKDGEVLSFNVEAPQGYSVPPDVDQSLWQITVKYPDGGRPLQVDFPAQLQRPEREYLVMVRTSSPATPVKVNDKNVGKTGPTGEALLRIRGIPGTRLSARAGTVTYQGKFAEDDEVYLLTAMRSGPVARGAAPIAAAPAEEPPAPDGVAAAPPPVAPAPIAAAPVAAARDPEPWVEPAAPSKPRRSHRAETIEWEPEPRTRPEPRRRPEPEPDPEPLFVEPPPAAAKAEPSGGGIDDLLDVPPPAPAAASSSGVDDLLADDSPPPRPKPTKAAGGFGDLADDGEVVDRTAADRKASVSAGSGPSVSGMSRSEVSRKVNDIKSRLGQSGVLQRAEVGFLSQIGRESGKDYREANRLLADFYFRLKDWRRQAQSLEEATKRGRYKHDPQVLFSLAQAYGKQRRYGKALSTMRRVESKMRNMPANRKGRAYAFYAEMLEFEFLRQFHDDPKRANVTLLDRAITKWERFRTFGRGSSPGAVKKANDRIKKLEELKGNTEL